MKAFYCRLCILTTAGILLLMPGIGISEELNPNAVFRADALWRFSNNRRHRVDFTWFSFRCDGN